MPRIRSASILALLICSALAGCRREVPELPEEDRRHDVLAAIERVDPEALRRAFGLLETVDHERTLVVSQEDRDGREIARVTQVVEFSNASRPGHSEVIRQDTVGNFDFGAFSRLVSDDMRIDALPGYAEHLIPDQPPYLRPQLFEDYVYTFAPDTVIDGARVRVARILLTPAAAGDHQIIEARYYLDEETDELAAFFQEREYDAFLFTERSEAFFSLAGAPERPRMPRAVRARTELRLALTARRIFRVQIDYDYPDSFSRISTR